MSPTSLPLSSDDNINEGSNMAACKPDGIVSLQVRQERSLEVDHKPKINNLAWYFADVTALTHGGDDGHGIRDEEADSFTREILMNPAQVIGLSGCDKQLQNYLQTPVARNRLTGQPLLMPADGDIESQSSAFEYLVMRAREPLSVLVGVRALTGKQLILKNGDACFTNATETSWHTAGR